MCYQRLVLKQSETKTVNEDDGTGSCGLVPVSRDADKVPRRELGEGTQGERQTHSKP